MTDKEEFSKREEKIISDALHNSSIEAPELISTRIRKAARDNLKADKNDEPKQDTGRFWYKLLPIAASVIISFYAGKTYQDIVSPSSNNAPLVFQGDKANLSTSNAKEWTEDKLLKAIAEAALAGDIQRAEDLITLYKKNYARDSR